MVELTDKDKAAEYDRIAAYLQQHGWSVASMWRSPVDGMLHENWFKGDPHSQMSLMAAFTKESWNDAPRQGERMAANLNALNKVIDDKQKAATFKIGMQYDGDPNNNPLVPSFGDWVLICEHQPRPKHITLYEKPIELEGHAFRRLNLCEACAAGSIEELHERRSWHVYVWTAEDVRRVREASKSASDKDA